MTETTATPTLQLVRVAATPERIPEGDYFAVEGAYAPHYWTLIVPEDDPRHERMWEFDVMATADELAARPDDGKTYRGWRVPSSSVTGLDTSEPASEPTTFGELAVDDIWTNRPDSGGRWRKTGPTSCMTEGSGSTYTYDNLPTDYPVTLIERAAPADSEPASEATDDTDSRVAQLQRELSDARDTLARERREIQAWKQEATETAHRYAQANNLCVEFDKCMEEIGLEPREGMLDREFRVTRTETVYVTARDAGQAVEYADFSYSEPDYDVEEV